MTFDHSRIHDFAYYAPRMLKVKTIPPDSRVVPFVFNPIQAKFDAFCERLFKRYGMVRVNVLKARREGFSTYGEGRIFHGVHTNENTHAFIIAHRKKSADTIFDMSKLFYDCLPEAYRPQKRYSSKKELVFENPSDKTRFTEPGLRSRIEVYTANEADAARSAGYTYGHFSEIAFYDYAEEVLTPFVSLIPDVPGTFIMRETTANGRGDFFHEEWKRAKAGISNYHNFFASFLAFPDYATPFQSDIERQKFIRSIGHVDDPSDAEEEKMLVSKHHASPEQLYFRRRKLMDFHGDLDKFHSEYPVDDIEAFVASGNPYFSRSRLRNYLTKTVDPVFVGTLDGLGLHENQDGDLLLWEHPEPGFQYCLGVDVAEGLDDGDLSTIEVLKVPRDGSPFIAQVGEFAAHMDPVNLAALCVWLGRYYNEGMLSIELNGPGLTTLNEVKEVYWNLYRWQYFDRFGKTYTSKLGWETNVGTRPLLCDYTAAAVSADILVIRSEALVDEMMSFIKRQTSFGGEAEANAYDDRVMAYMIALFTLAHTFQSSSLLKELGSFSTPIMDKKTKGIAYAAPSHHDHDEYMSRMITGAYPDTDPAWYGGEQGWMNY